MRVSFSTLGCPGWSWDDMVATAKDLGFDGIEIRGVENELYTPKARPFLKENISSTISRLNRLNINISCLTSSCYLFDKDNIDIYLEEGKEYIDLAEKIGVPYVRVLGDANPEPGENIDIDFVAANLLSLAEYAKNRNITILLETNGIFADSNKMKNILIKTNHPSIGVLWDIHHPYRYMGEKIYHTFNVLKDYIKHVHIKDSTIENSKVKYKMTGDGDVPVKEAILILKNNGFNGYISLEWVKRWCMELEEPGIVFSHFANYTREITK